MSTQQYNPGMASPPNVHSPPLHSQQRPFDPVKSHVMEVENIKDRSQREQSVLSGMSIEDMEAAETLNSLHKGNFESAVIVPRLI